MVIYGYARVSTEGQTLAAQESALHQAGAAKVFKEKISGVANHRAQLHRLLKTIDAGDVEGLIGWPDQRGTCSTFSTRSRKRVRPLSRLAMRGQTLQQRTAD
jgi:hypothetical protein